MFMSREKLIMNKMKIKIIIENIKNSFMKLKLVIGFVVSKFKIY